MRYPMLLSLLSMPLLPGSRGSMLSRRASNHSMQGSSSSRRRLRSPLGPLSKRRLGRQRCSPRPMRWLHGSWQPGLAGAPEAPAPLPRWQHPGPRPRPSCRPRLLRRWTRLFWRRGRKRCSKGAARRRSGWRSASMQLQSLPLWLPVVLRLLGARRSLRDRLRSRWQVQHSGHSRARCRWFESCSFPAAQGPWSGCGW